MSLIRRQSRPMDHASLLNRPMFAWPDWLAEQLETFTETATSPSRSAGRTARTSSVLNCPVSTPTAMSRQPTAYSGRRPLR